MDALSHDSPIFCACSERPVPALLVECTERPLPDIRMASTKVRCSVSPVRRQLKQSDPFGRYFNRGSGYESQVQGGNAGGHLQMEVDFSAPGQTVSTVIDFADNTFTGADSVSNLSFTLLDLDSPSSGNYQDQVTILAYDADGNLLPVTLTAVDPSVVGITDNVATAIVGGGSGGSQGGNVASTSTEGNVQVTVEGDVTQLVIEYGSGSGARSNPTSQGNPPENQWCSRVEFSWHNH